MKILRSVIYFLALVGLGSVLLWAFVSFGPIPSCKVTELRMVISPSKQHEARLVVKKCTDKNDTVLELSISDKTDPNRLHSADIGIATTTDVDLTWLSGNKLQVSYPLTFQLTQQPSELDGIEIEFVTKPISNTSFNTDAPKRAC